MPRDATLTRERLVRAAQRRFARDGVAGARLADVVRDAGQSNDSAVGYHFGSREGLLRAVVDQHMATMESSRARTLEALGSADVMTVVRLVVEPTAALLGTPGGRDFLRITEQLAGSAGVRRGEPAGVLRGTALSAQLDRLEELLVARMPRRLARERVAALVRFLTASLAERARNREHQPRQGVGHDRYVAELVAMLAGAMTAIS
ncbi:MAG: TetR/AcrR family transcriptional regulator [Marmoricola sp.]